MVITDQHVQELADMLDSTDEEILNRFKFTVNDNWLSEEEAIRFIHFLRNELKERKH